MPKTKFGLRGLAGVGLSAVLAAVAGVPSPVAAAPAGPQQMAFSRCNSRTISDDEGQIRQYDAHPPSGGADKLEHRYGEIADVLESLNREREILDQVCPSEDDKIPLFSQISAAAAWGLALQSDITVKLNASCPAAAKALPGAMLAQAWLDLASPVNAAGGTVPPAIAEIVPKIQTRAAAVGLTLPAFPETSAYWRTQVSNQAKSVVEGCVSPAPVPSATP